MEYTKPMVITAEKVNAANVVMVLVEDLAQQIEHRS